jgi:hypothetical protein
VATTTTTPIVLLKRLFTHTSKLASLLHSHRTIHNIMSLYVSCEHTWEHLPIITTKFIHRHQNRNSQIIIISVLTAIMSKQIDPNGSPNKQMRELIPCSCELLWASKNVTRKLSHMQLDCPNMQSLHSSLGFPKSVHHTFPHHHMS